VLALINPLSWILFALGLIRRSLSVALVLAPIVIGSYVLGLSRGPEGVALAYSAGMMVWAIPHMMWCVHRTPVSLGDLLRALGRPLFSAVVAAAIAKGIVILWAGAWQPLPRLLLAGMVLVGTYLVTLLYGMGQKPIYEALFKELWTRRSPTPENLVVSA
jgi:PST family polysaccharide transporter